MCSIVAGTLSGLLAQVEPASRTTSGFECADAPGGTVVMTAHRENEKDHAMTRKSLWHFSLANPEQQGHGDWL